MIPRALLVPLAFCVAISARAADDAPAGWRAGVATAVITPKEPMWMAGYAARTRPSEGKIHDLYVKALALESAGRTRLVVVTADLIGIPRELRDRIEAEASRLVGLSPASLLLNASHTHCGPELRATKAAVYGLAPDRARQTREYFEWLCGAVTRVIGEAVERLSPARLSYTHARAGFAMNRRLPTASGFQNRPNPDGPVDHDVPVLKIESADGALRAVAFGYACHPTTLSFYQFCGDWAGFAQSYLEEAHAGATALFLAGCGGDQNPQPRRTLDLARQHGRALANAVDAALISRPRDIDAALRVELEEVTLEFAPPPDREELERQARSENTYVSRHASLLLAELERSGTIRSTYPYPVQVVRFGDDLTLIALAGEVVVDYSLRFKREFPGEPLWVAAYSNDVFGYVPSRRVLEEGGYEGGGAMLYTALPGPFAPSVEERIAGHVRKLVEKVRRPAR